MDLITLDDPPRMNLLGLILANIIERNIQQPTKKQLFDRLRGELLIRANEMTVTLSFNQGKLLVKRAVAQKPTATLQGTMETFMNLSLGGGIIGPFFRGDLRPKGNLFFLFKVKSLLMVE